MGSGSNAKELEKMNVNTTIKGLLGVGVFAFVTAAQAGLVLDTAVTSFFSPAATTTDTLGNDLPAPLPSTLHFGQIRAANAGTVEFFYVGNEAAYTNQFKWGNNHSFSTQNLPDNFNAPHVLLGSLSVSANELLDFGFCTDGGRRVNRSRCVWNDNAMSIVSQFNYEDGGGYRSIGYAALSAFDPSNGARSFTSPNGEHDLWMAFWDDSGAKNDDNHDDMIVGMRFRPVRVSEPGSFGLVALGLAALMWASRRSPLTSRRPL